MRYVLQPQARQDIEERSDYSEERGGEELALRFIASVTEALAQLLEHPEIGSPRSARSPRLLGLRAWPIPNFEDVRLYYLLDGKVLSVLRVLHGRQDTAAVLDEGTPEGA